MGGITMALHFSGFMVTRHNHTKVLGYCFKVVNRFNSTSSRLVTIHESTSMSYKKKSFPKIYYSRKFSSSTLVAKEAGNDMTEVKNKQVQTATYAQKTKENVKTASYGIVIVVGVGVTCVVLYTILKELFTGESPTALFQMASEKCVEHPQVQDLLGEPIKAFGEESRRGRRRHVTSYPYVDEHGRKGIRVQFYLQGLRKRATAQIDAREGEDGHFKTRYIIVTADDLLRTSVVVEDNR